MRISADIRNTMPWSFRPQPRHHNYRDPTRPVPSTDSHLIMHWTWLHLPSTQLCKEHDNLQYTILKQVPINTCCIVQTTIVKFGRLNSTFNPTFWQQSNVNCCAFPGKVILQKQTQVFGAWLPCVLVLLLLPFDILLPFSIKDFNCFFPL
jgi:hypothetical protein